MAYRAVFRALQGLRALGAAAAGVASGTAGFLAAPAGAQEAEARAPSHVEAWSGGEAFSQFWSVYSGANWAPFGDVQSDGFRLRGVVGYGDYGSGTVTFTDLLVGHHKQLGPVIVKVLGGITFAEHVSGEQAPSGIGGRGIIEAWWIITERAWASADLSLATLHVSNPSHLDYNGRLRAGWRVRPELSAGVEGGAVGTWERELARIGGFMRYEWAAGEVSISAGLTVDEPLAAESTSGAFATVSLLTRF